MLTDARNGHDTGDVTQAAWGPDGRLYVATAGSGVRSFAYDPEAGLSGPRQESDINSLGIAFHGWTMYLSPFAGFGANDSAGLTILTSAGPEGEWGGAVEIVNNIPVLGHGVNQIQITGGALYVGIGTRGDLGADENSYTGTVAWIQDLAAAEASAAPGSAGLEGCDFTVDPIPYTSDSASKLVVHSSGARNPYGLAVDGDSRLWMTNNERDLGTGDPGAVYQDQLFRLAHRGDYGFPNDNWRDEPAVLAAGFFRPENRVAPTTLEEPDPAYDPADPTPGDPPGGLGPHSSANGFAFYTGHDLPLRYHQRAFITRWQAFRNDDWVYSDVVAVDTRTGHVERIAAGFDSGPIDVIEDGHGNLLVFVFGGGDRGVWRLSPAQPRPDDHEFHWDNAEGGDWSQAEAWNHSMPVTERRPPHQWGTARYAVTIDGGPDVTVRVDRDATVQSLVLGSVLDLGAERVLRIVESLEILPDGVLEVTLPEAGSPGDGGSMEIGGTASLAGELRVRIADGRQPQWGERFTIFTASGVTGAFDTVAAVDPLPPGAAWEATLEGGAVVLTVGPDEGTFEEWRAVHFAPEELADPDTSGPLADPGRTGVPNLMRYYFALNPRLPLDGPLPAFSVETVDTDGVPARHAALTLQRRSDPGNVAAVVMRSDDLLSWTPAEVAEEVLHTGAVAETVRVRLADPLPAGPEAGPVFLRLDLTLEDAE
ncbi:MAG: hypothetical protein JJU00_13795 [Opitutales bacterium]|nr:hypothetical protein [Opitutales bacterium]